MGDFVKAFPRVWRDRLVTQLAEVPGITAFGEYIFAARCVNDAEVLAPGSEERNEAATALFDAAVAQQVRPKSPIFTW